MENTKCNLPEPSDEGSSFYAGRRNSRRWPVLVPWLIYCALIFYFSSQSRFFIQPPQFFSSDKVYHFLEYLILGILTVRLARTYGIMPERPVGPAVFFCLLYALSDEFHQWFVPGRWSTWGDVLADTLGGWTGAKVYTLWGRLETRNPKSKEW